MESFNLSSNHRFIVAGPVSSDSVAKVEQELSVKLPNDYREFVLKYGALLGDGFEVFGLFEKDAASEPPLFQCMRDNTLEQRKCGLGYDHVVISHDGSATTFCLNTQISRKGKN